MKLVSFTINSRTVHKIQHGGGRRYRKFPSKFWDLKVWHGVLFYSKLVPVHVYWYCLCYIKICFYCTIPYWEYLEKNNVPLLKSYERFTAGSPRWRRCWWRHLPMSDNIFSSRGKNLAGRGRGWATAMALRIGWAPSSGRGPTGLQARVRNRGRLENRGHVVPKNGVSRWRWPNSDIYSQNYHFGLSYDMIYQFLGMEAKNYKFGMFCQKCHPSVASVIPIFDREMPPGFTPDIYLHCNFVYISNLENRGDKSLDQNF